MELEDSIVRFWSDFLAKQISVGRRDVGRMLEIALEFYFERSTQVASDDHRRRELLETFIRQVRSEISKCEAQLAIAAQGEVLGAPYRGLQITVRTDGGDTPVEIKPYPAPFTQVAELVTYHGTLIKQAAAAEEAVQRITEKLVQQRRVIAQRLKELSPSLYQQGLNMIANATLTGPNKAAAQSLIRPLVQRQITNVQAQNAVGGHKAATSQAGERGALASKRAKAR